MAGPDPAASRPRPWLKCAAMAVLAAAGARPAFAQVFIQGQNLSTTARATQARNPTAVVPGSASASAPLSSPVLYLANGGTLPGVIQPSDRPGEVRWLGTPFVEPFAFPLNRVNALHWPPPAKPVRAEGDYCFELSGGDLVFGSLVSLDADKAELDLARYGRRTVRRSALHRIDRWRGGADLVYLGPNGLTGWKEAGTSKHWREEAGQLCTEAPGAVLRSDLGLPARAAVEFELSWKERPDFTFALGTGDTDAARPAARFEVWDGELVVQRETDREADLASLAKLTAGPGRVHLTAYLDQEKGRVIVMSPAGKRLADLSVRGRDPRVLGGVQVANVRGDLRLERLRVSRWDGDPPRETSGDRSRVVMTDSTVVGGEVVGYDAKEKAFVLKTESNERRVPSDKVAGVVLNAGDDGPARAVRVVDLDGARLSGGLVGVTADAVRLDVPGLGSPLEVPVNGLRSLVVLKHESYPSTPGDGPAARLESAGTKVTGRLAEGTESDGRSSLVWRPFGSENASPLRPGVAGRIVFRDPPPPARPVQTNTSMVVQPANGAAVVFNAVISRGGRRPSTATLTLAAQKALHLRTGDVIPCEVTSIGEDGVRFRTPVAGDGFVSHDKVQAVVLGGEAGAPSVRLSKAKRERLLTLPRMQRNSPPTQLVRSRNGDYLRGRVLSLDDKSLKLEVRLDTQELPRDRISRILWLHPEPPAGEKKAEAPAPPPETRTRVQALRSDGTRLTFYPESFGEQTLSGKSDVLGACRVEINQVDQLLLGRAIEEVASQLTIQRWKLTNAPDPRAFSSDGGSTAGTESPLVGRPAPDFELELIGGKPFKLSANRGKVIVLDFWATWCGPCLQAMPQVEKVTDEFKDRGVQLVAVNLQETPDKIKAMLERHKLHPTVALDRDGIVALKYAANAIPQTVVIDKNGVVSRLFVGGGPHLGEQLKEAITAVLDGKPAEPPATQ